MNKYRNIKVQENGIKFDSKKELARYNELKLLVKAKEISNLLMQVKFELIPKQKDERAVSYYADFVYEEKGQTIVEDVKSFATKKDKAYIIKRKLLKYKYPDVIFREV